MQVLLMAEWLDEWMHHAWLVLPLVVVRIISCHHFFTIFHESWVLMNHHELHSDDH